MLQAFWLRDGPLSSRTVWMTCFFGLIRLFLFLYTSSRIGITIRMSELLQNSSRACWSSGMILASGARGPGFNSRTGPLALYGSQ